MRRDDRGRHGHLQNGPGGETDLRTNAGAEMGHRDGRVRVHRRDVSLLRGVAGNRSAYSGRCLHFRLPAKTRSAPRRLDEIAGKNFWREIIRRAKAGMDEEIDWGNGMSPSRTGSYQNMSSRTNVRDLPKAVGSYKVLSVTLASTVRFLAPLEMTPLLCFFSQFSTLNPQPSLR